MALLGAAACFESSSLPLTDAGADVATEPADAGSDATQVPIDAGTDAADSNQGPVFTSDSRVPFRENSVDDVLVLTATDDDGPSALTFSIVGGPDAMLFDLDEVSGTLRFRIAPDFERPADQDKDNRYLLDVAALDGADSARQRIAVEVTDEPSPRIVGEFPQRSVEGETVAGTITSTNPNGRDLSFSIVGGGDGILLSIDAATGVVSFMRAPALDNPADGDGDNVYLAIVRVTDGAEFSERSVSFQVVENL